MENIDTNKKCAYCQTPGSGKYCSSCGQTFAAKRLTMQGVFEEAFHFFTHFDKGFAYTLKMLLIAPGRMQKEYLGGVRARHQKPFSMFFICTSTAALLIYWVNHVLNNFYHTGNSGPALFFHQYWVLLQIALLPFYSLVPYLIFKKSGYNYAEMVVFQLYTFSMLVLMVAIINLTRLFFHDLQTRYIELPLLAIYSIVTNFNFFNAFNKSSIILKTILSIVLCFTIASLIQDELIRIMFP